MAFDAGRAAEQHAKERAAGLHARPDGRRHARRSPRRTLRRPPGHARRAHLRLPPTPTPTNLALVRADPRAAGVDRAAGPTTSATPASARPTSSATGRCTYPSCRCRWSSRARSRSGPTPTCSTARGMPTAWRWPDAGRTLAVDRPRRCGGVPRELDPARQGGDLRRRRHRLPGARGRARERRSATGGRPRGPPGSKTIDGRSRRPAAPRVILVDRPGAIQSVIRVGEVMPSALDSERASTSAR